MVYVMTQLQEPYLWEKEASYDVIRYVSYPVHLTADILEGKGKYGQPEQFLVQLQEVEGSWEHQCAMVPCERSITSGSC
jgi:hypothetical protein